LGTPPVKSRVFSSLKQLMSTTRPQLTTGSAGTPKTTPAGARPLAARPFGASRAI